MRHNKVSRRELLRGSLAAAGAWAVGPRSFGQSSRSESPNVLMIAVDDLNDWIGVLGGHPQANTPHIDRLAGRGVAFERAYCQAPACNPSRASVMTGLRPTTSGVYQNSDLWRDALPHAVTLPQHFMLHGYSVLGGGKIYHGTQNDAASWEAYYNFDGFLHPPETPVNGIPGTGHFDWGAIRAEDRETADTRLALWAGDFLQQKHERPFFLACGFYRPHLPWYAPEKYFERFPEAATMLPEVLENDIADVPKSALRSLRDHDNVTSRGQWKRAVASYLACIHYADRNVGRVLEALDQGPHARDTVIVLWTDHGWQLGEKQQWRKFTLWERSTRVAMVFAGAGVPQQGASCGRTVELLDIYPTLIDLCGLPPRDEIEGRSLRPLLANAKAPWDKPAITSNGPDKISVRTERWRYSRYPDGEEFYDHGSDPHEWHNLAAKPEHAEVKGRLAALLPQKVSRKKVKSSQDLGEDEWTPAPVLPGRHPMPDPLNEIGKKRTL